ncbi:hypothetical protein G7Y89_g6839 [Cudoniella acicularis]|uniref:Mid2 domain-containing protein n=1 Tax=Cudoniella acicularis TaxID=354080 RepID=A0A8H4RJN2_9HELO|nr:hypothetical protein G7Y89_g6839 [Cudoniella acicularis]
MTATTLPPELNNNILTSWLPLTTPGPSQLPECASAFRLELLAGTTSNVSVTNIVAYDPWYGQAIDASLRSCLAYEQTQWWDQDRAPSTIVNLGPFACPTPYTTATASVINAETTLIACCPSDYAFQSTILPPLSGRQCLSPLIKGQVITAKSGSLGNWTSTIATVTQTDLGIWGNQVNGYIFADAPASVSATSTAAPTNTAISNNAPTNSVTSAPQKSSTATPSIFSTMQGKIGIGIAGGVGLIGICCLIGALVIFCRRGGARRKTRPSELEANPKGEREHERELERPSDDEKSFQELSTTTDYYEICSRELEVKKPPVAGWV